MSETASKATGSPTPVPTNKVISGGVAGAATVLAVAVTGFVLPPEVTSEKRPLVCGIRG